MIPTRFTALVLVLLAAGAFRLSGLAHYDLWLDEIWSVTSVDPAGPITAIANLHHDNNHLLNSVWIWIVGPNQNPVVYRLASFVASILSVWLAYSLSAVFGVMLACSYPFVLYGSEARGYSFAILGILTCAVSVCTDQSNRKSLLQFWIGSVIGVLGHLTFLLAIPSLLLLALRRDRGHAEILTVRVIPLCALVVWLFWYFIPAMTIGGGPRGNVLEVLLNGLAVTFGANEMSVHDLEGSVRTLSIALVGLTAGIVGTVVKTRQHPLQGLAVGIGSFAVPAIWLLASQPEFVLPRYFLVSYLFILWGCAWFFEFLVRRDLAAQILALLLVAGFCGGGAGQTWKLFQIGRGDPIHVLVTASEAASPERTVVFSSNSAFRVGMVLRYYATELGVHDRFSVNNGNATQPAAGELFIAEQLDRAAPVTPIPDTEILATFPAAPLSGLPWTLYRSIQPKVSGQPSL